MCSTCVITFLSSNGEFVDMNKLVSSAKSLILTSSLLIQFTISLVYKRKRGRPKIDPCRTPYSLLILWLMMFCLCMWIVDGYVNRLWTTVDLYLWYHNDLIYLTFCDLKVSKALYRSTFIPATFFPFSRSYSMLSVISINAYNRVIFFEEFAKK